MDELAGVSRSPDWPPPLLDDLLLEILLRLSPEPIYLFRASFVSKHWRGLVHDAGFLRRFREFHGGAPPLLGFFHLTWPPFFAPTSGFFTVSTPTMYNGYWWPLDCHRGRALLLSERSRALLVRDLVTGDERYLPLPPGFEGGCGHNSAVLSAAGHPDHCDCRSCPFLVTFVFSGRVTITSACLYSSETGLWGQITSISTPGQFVSRKPMVLLGNTLYCLLEDGRLGLAGFEKFSLHLWSGIAGIDDDGMIAWAHHRVVDLEKFLAPEVVEACTVPVWAVGYAEHADAIFVEVSYSGVYMIHLKSMQIEKVSEYAIRSGYICPYTSFYAPGTNIGGRDDQPELLNGS